MQPVIIQIETVTHKDEPVPTSYYQPDPYYDLPYFGRVTSYDSLDINAKDRKAERLIDVLFDNACGKDMQNQPLFNNFDTTKETGHGLRVGDKLLFQKDFRNAYFEAKYQHFQKACNMVTDVAFQTFQGESYQALITQLTQPSEIYIERIQQGKYGNKPMLYSIDDFIRTLTHDNQNYMFRITHIKLVTTFMPYNYFR